MNRNVTIAIVVIAIIFLFLYHRKKALAETELNQEILQQPNRILVVGSSGDDVKLLQRKLNFLIEKATRRKVELFCQYTQGQQSQRVGMLTVDGIFGPKTACALKAMFGKISIDVADIPKLTIEFPEGITVIDTIKWE